MNNFFFEILKYPNIQRRNKANITFTKKKTQISNQEVLPIIYTLILLFPRRLHTKRATLRLSLCYHVKVINETRVYCAHGVQ